MTRCLFLLCFLLPATLQPATLTVSTLSGGGPAGFADGVKSESRWNYPFGLASDLLGNLYIADSENQVIRVVHPDGNSGIIAGRVGSVGHEDGRGSEARIRTPLGITVGPTGDLYVADTGNQLIRRIDSEGNVTTVAGVAGDGRWADGYPREARFCSPAGITIDPNGVLYVADTSNHCIRTITTDGVVRTLAGTPRKAGSEDGFGTLATFAFPFGIAFARGELIVSDGGNHVIRSVSLGGVVRTLYGSAGVRGYADGTGSAARFARPAGVAVDTTGTIVVADSENDVIRVIQNGRVSTLAGTPGSACFRDGSAQSSCFDMPLGVALLGSRIIVADTYNQALRTIELRNARGRGVRR